MGNCLNRPIERQPFITSSNLRCARCANTLIEIAALIETPRGTPHVNYYCRKCKTTISVNEHNLYNQ